MVENESSISDALEALAISLGEAGAVPVSELARALERAAERLRYRATPVPAPDDLVSQAEASRRMGVSRQAVNQWVRKGVLRTYDTVTDAGRHGQGVSLSEVAVAANRGAPEAFRADRRRELTTFLDALPRSAAGGLAEQIQSSFEAEPDEARFASELRVLREFVVAAMDTREHQREFTASGVRQLSELSPTFIVDRSSDFGATAESLGLLVASSDGVAGFDSASTAMLGLLGIATVGAQFDGPGRKISAAIAEAAESVWMSEWPERLYEAVFHVGEGSPSPLTRYTSSLTYLDNNRFLRQAQQSGVSISYSRGPGPILPQRFFGAPIFADILGHHGRRGGSPWAFTSSAAESVGQPLRTPSAVNPFRIFNYEFGLLDTSIHGIRRYCYSADDARDELKRTVAELGPEQRTIYIDTAIDTLARTLGSTPVELAVIDDRKNFDWWKDHIIRASEREIVLGLRDERARTVAHALLVHTSMLPDLVNAADNDSALRDRLRIYVKNLEFEVVDARYRDDLRLGVARIVKEGGLALDAPSARRLAEAEIASYLK
ncbi:MAG: hypothetical protein JWQ19_3822 [Subtercola sp.]|nr:hypothetical protein [Subtercola sp.]